MEVLLRKEVVNLTSQYSRYGYRRVTALLRMSGCQLNHKHVELIWRQAGLKVPANQPKRGQRWMFFASKNEPTLTSKMSPFK